MEFPVAWVRTGDLSISGPNTLTTTLRATPYSKRNTFKHLEHTKKLCSVGAVFSDDNIIYLGYGMGFKEWDGWVGWVEKCELQ